MGTRSMIGVGLGVVMAGMAFAPSAGAAAGLYSFQGDDYSYDHNAIRQVRMCDGEADGNDTHADFYVIGSGSLRQVHTDTGQGDCQSSGVYSQKIYRHRAVEEVFGEDPKGPWRYPS